MNGMNDAEAYFALYGRLVEVVPFYKEKFEEIV
jgi:hypothetical protein